MRQSQRGFTIIELLIVTVVIGVLASILIVSIRNVLDRGKQRGTMADMRMVSRALEAYSVDNNFLPSDEGGLAALVDDLVPRHADVLPLRDHWGHALRYVRIGAGSYSLESFAKDGVDGDNWDGWKHAGFEHDIVILDGLFVAAPDA
jgi:general secretion pathway protein G